MMGFLGMVEANLLPLLVAFIPGQQWTFPCRFTDRRL